MANKRDTLDEGVDYTITVNTPVDTSGETLTAKLFAKNGSGEWTLGTASGGAADTDIDITLDTKSRSPGFYFLEVWVDIDNNNGNRDLIDPDEDEDYIIRIKDREQI